MFSLTHGRPIARISGGKYNNEILYVYDPDSEKVIIKKKTCKKCNNVDSDSDSDNELPTDEMAIINSNFFPNLKGNRKLVQTETLRRALKRDIEPLEIEMADLYKKAKCVIRDKSKKEIILHDGELSHIPNPNGREILYISAPSGSGKSTYCAKYAREFKKLFPDRNVFLFSRLDEDKILDDINPKRINIDEELIEDPIEPSELSNSLVIFDDCDTIPNKEIKDNIIQLQNDILETGRHHNVYTILTSHLINNYRVTRTILNEAHCLTIYPCSGSSYAIRYCLKSYFGLSNLDINKILKLPSRWVTIFKNYPQCVLYDKGAYLLST